MTGSEMTRSEHVAKGVGFREALAMGVRDWNWRRRGSRSEFWWLVLLFVPVSSALSLLSQVKGLGFVIGAVWLFFYIVLIKAMVRRYHDIGRGAGWVALQIGVWTVCLFVMLLGFVAVIVSALGSGASGRANLFYHLGLLGGVAALGDGIWMLVWLSLPGEQGQNRWG